MRKTTKDIERVIMDFWWERYGPIHRTMNERTRKEIEELAERIHSLVYDK